MKKTHAKHCKHRPIDCGKYRGRLGGNMMQRCSLEITILRNLTGTTGFVQNWVQNTNKYAPEEDNHL
jgi:hypothetical protein